MKLGAILLAIAGALGILLAAITAHPQAVQQANSSCQMRGNLPDPLCTPGAINPNVTQASINQTICVKGWTATVRPPVSYTSGLKTQGIKAYGFIDTNPTHYEEDHLISLELGGAPSDPKNLWPEPGASPNAKDKVENALHDAVCAGRIQLSEAQQRISTNWTTALEGVR